MRTATRPATEVPAREGGVVEASSLQIESLHKACGSVEVAKDLLGRSQSLYADSSEMVDHEIVDYFVDATRALSRVVEAIEAHLRGTRLGPAA